MQTRSTLIALALIASLSSTAAISQTPPAAAAGKERGAARMQTADTDKDGMISKAEADKSMPRLAQSFDKLDTNKDGKLSAEELKAGRDGMRGKRHHEKRDKGGRNLLSGADANKDGVITRQELETALARKNPKERVMQAFDAADSNKDGKLSQEEQAAFKQKQQVRAGKTPAKPAPQP